MVWVKGWQQFSVFTVPHILDTPHYPGKERLRCTLHALALQTKNYNLGMRPQYIQYSVNGIIEPEIIFVDLMISYSLSFSKGDVRLQSNVEKRQGGTPAARACLEVLAGGRAWNACNRLRGTSGTTGTTWKAL